MSPPRRVLVVDDYEPSRYGFRRILSAAGGGLAHGGPGGGGIGL